MDTILYSAQVDDNYIAASEGALSEIGYTIYRKLYTIWWVLVSY